MSKTTDLSYGIAAPNYRLPAPTHVGRVKLQVADLARSLSYYQEVLGLRVLDRSPRHATLGAQAAAGSQGSRGARGAEADVLVELHERSGARPVARRGLLGLYHFAILLPDRAALGRFLRHLSDVGARAGMSDHLVSEAIYLQDPDNLGIEVYADRPRSEWTHERGQISMTTIPLDAEDVMAAAGSERWSGMPAGTRVGHVHLHVGDLPAAEAFYHTALGLDKTVWNYPGALFLSAGGYHHHLGTNTWARDAANASDNDARLLEWEIVVPDSSDIEAAAASLRGAGHTVERAEAGVTVKDPWGTQLRITTERA